MFSVYKSKTALAEVMSAWQNADEVGRDRIERAMLGLEHHLQENPHEQGESRNDDTRVLFEHPLALTVAIDDAARLVRVVRAWTFGRQAAA